MYSNIRVSFRETVPLMSSLSEAKMLLQEDMREEDEENEDDNEKEVEEESDQEAAGWGDVAVPAVTAPAVTASAVTPPIPLTNSDGR